MVSPKNSSGTITSTEVRTLLRTAAASLSAREEKALRMRTGVSLPKNQVLPRRGQGSPEARAELLALELELTQKLAERAAAAKAPAPKKPAAKAASTTRSKEKEKIIRALRRLK
jgi:hypothetical protein